MDGIGLKRPNRDVRCAAGRVDRWTRTYVYGRADGRRGFPRILVMDDWEREDSLRGGVAEERGWTYAPMTGGWD